MLPSFAAAELCCCRALLLAASTAAICFRTQSCAAVCILSNEELLPEMQERKASFKNGQLQQARGKKNKNDISKAFFNYNNSIIFIICSTNFDFFMYHIILFSDTLYN